MIRDDIARLIGRSLQGKWRLDALIGEGGMATVFSATHRNGMRGAIKILHPHLVSDAQVRARLIREGYLANRIAHPGVVRIIDDDVTEDGLAFLVMELLEGETWKERWLAAGRKLPQDEVLRVGEAVLDILAAAHATGVVHRDVKPDNVFLVNDGSVKLLDFGIARFKEGNVEATQTGAMLGTPAFMSPEQALAHWDEVDARSDVFSVGATLWVLLTNRLVHEASTVPELLVAAATKRVAPFANVAPDAPEGLGAVIDRALQFEPADRWPDAAAMRDAISAVRAGRAAGTPRAKTAAVVETTPVVKTIPIAIERKVEHAPMTSDDADVATTIATVDRTVAMRPTETAKTSPGLVTAHPSAARRWWWIGALGAGAAGAVAFFAMQPPVPTDDLAPTPILSASSRTTDACGGAGEACCDGGACSLATDACIDGRCLGSVTAIFAGPIQTCATRRDGTVLCWGDNAPPLIDPGGPPIVDAPVLLRNVRAPSHLAFGYEVGFAVVDGSLRGWGKNAFDLLGPSLPTEGSSSEPASVEVGVDRVTSLDVGLGGPQNACAVADGKLTCWGDSNALFGPSSERVNAVGPRPITLPPTPMPMRSVEVGVGGSQFACARRVVSGTDVTSVVCWGNATPWHLALGPAHPPVEFQVRSLIEGADLSMAVGTHSACVGWRTDVRCWERTPGCAANAGGQDLLLHRLPAPVHSMVGGMGHYCARMEADAVACWGRNHAGQTGQPASVAWVCEPTPVTFPARVSQIVVGNHHTCALTVDGHVYCLGANDRGQRGCGPEGPEHAPCRVGVPAR